MSHIDPEQLALIALGEPVESDADRRHLEDCERCANELIEMRHAALVGRTAIGDEIEAPSARVWTQIHGQLGLSDALSADPLSADPLSADPLTGGEAVAEDSRPALPAPRRRRRSRVLWVLAASLAVVAAVGGGIWAGSLATQEPVAIASATLDAFPAHPQAAGQAEVTEQEDGSRDLMVTVNIDDSEGVYREVWLIRNDGQALISLGVLDGERGMFRIPDGVDLQDYDLVDISFEPIDGDPAHSGDSIVRGALDIA